MNSPLLPTYARADVAFERGEGAWLMTRDGERYLDFGGGIAVNALGHAHPHLVAALTEQAGRLWHTSNLFRIPEGERLAQRLVDATFADTVFFTNSGAEAIEARSRWRANTTPPTASRSASASSPSRAPSTAARSRRSRPAGRRSISKASARRSRASTRSRSATSRRCARRSRPRPAAILIEPIQGEGGIRAVADAMPARPARALRRARPAAGLRRGADAASAAPASSSRMNGAASTPDIMAIAKGIGGGFPLGACLATERGGQGHDVGHPRHDLRRQSARHGGRQRRARRRARRRASSTTSGRSACF